MSEDNTFKGQQQQQEGGSGNDGEDDEERQAIGGDDDGQDDDEVEWGGDVEGDVTRPEQEGVDDDNDGIAVDDAVPPPIGGEIRQLLDNDDDIDRANNVTRGNGRLFWIVNLAIENILLLIAAAGWILFFVFLLLYVNETRTVNGGELIRAPVILELAMKDYEKIPFYKRMFISGSNTPVEDDLDNGIIVRPDINWTNQSGFWYLEVSPIRSTGRDCPVIKGGIYGNSEQLKLVDNPKNTSSCNLYDFRLVIYNDLTSGATVHFHGLTPPSNQDGVPSVANANIHPKNLQYYRFNQFTYPGMHWMHAHTGFQQAFGVAAPIILAHTDEYHKANKFSKENDLVVMLEEGFIFPHCAYSAYSWYYDECVNNPEIPKSDYGKLAFMINRGEEPLDHEPAEGVESMRIRFLNGGSEAPWRITDAYSNTAVNMEILATDGQDVERQTAFRREFVLGLANRIDVLINVTTTSDSVITAVQMKHSGNVTNPALRHIVIRGRDTPPDKRVNITTLPPYAKDRNSTILEDFNLFAELTAAHPHPQRPVTKNFTVVNRGGDQYGGFPLSIYEGFHLNPKDVEKKNLYPVKTYTQLNQLKFQLPPYKVWRHKEDGIEISTRRNCSECATFENYNNSGILPRPPPGENYTILYETNHTESGDKCCWEWCDVQEDECENFELVDVNEYRENKNYIPVCYGDRVQILFINTASFEGSEGHPMHLHGHDFTLTGLYNVSDDNGTLSMLENQEFSISGAKVDTIWVPFNRAISFQFDAYNPGEHLFHCHNDFHLENGMMTTIRYMHNDECNNLPKFTGGENPVPEQLCTMDDCAPSEKDEL